MKLKIAQIVGLNTDQKAALLLYQQREEEHFLAVLKLSCDDAFTKGRLALSELADFYFDFEAAPSEKLNATFKQAGKNFSTMGEFDLGLASISGKILYLIGQGEYEVYLKRLDKLSPLLQITTPAQIISGFLQEGDKVLLATKSLITFLGEDLSRSLSLPIDTFEEEVRSSLAKPDETAGSEGQLAGLAIEVEKNEDEVIPSLPQEEALEQPSHKAFKQSKELIAKKLHSLVAFAGKLTTLLPKGGRGRLILALILVAVVAVGVTFQYVTSRDKEKKTQFLTYMQSAKDDFQAAKGLSTLNPSEAKVKLDAAKSSVTSALNLYPKDKEAKDLLSQIESNAGSILQETTVTDFPQFLDLNLIKKDFKAQNLTLSAGKILLLDPQTQTLVSVDLAKKSQQILAGKDKLGDAKYASINGSLGFVYSENKGIIRIDITNQKNIQVAEKDEDWVKIKDIAGFAGNVYLLDNTQIWKYLPTTSGYSDKREYLTSATKADFANAIRMQIESSIYVLKEGGEMLRFTRGVKDHFSYGGLPSGVKDPKSFFVSSETDNLYLLDSGNQRLLILTKIGEYKGQITGDKFGTASDLVVDEKGKKVYLLEGSKIYTVDLK